VHAYGAIPLQLAADNRLSVKNRDGARRSSYDLRSCRVKRSGRVNPQTGQLQGTQPVVITRRRTYTEWLGRCPAAMPVSARQLRVDEAGQTLGPLAASVMSWMARTRTELPEVLLHMLKRFA
jgi:hypothetical protein